MSDREADLEKTLAALRAHPAWELALLAPRKKKPSGNKWQITRDEVTVRAHVEKGGNLGLMCSEKTGVVALDDDAPELWAEMVTELGEPGPAWVLTGSRKEHTYAAWAPGFAAKIAWHGETVGEIQRGPGKQMVVVPPSIHPNGEAYRWLVDPTQEPPPLPEKWLAHLTSSNGSVPYRGGADQLDPLLAAALRQPGARRRSDPDRVKFLCPGCRAGNPEWDEDRDNAAYFIDSRGWACAINPDHHDAIGEALGAPPNRSDAGLAKRFAAQHREVIRYCSESGLWYVWTDNKHWFPDRDRPGIKVTRLAEETAKRVYREVDYALTPKERAEVAIFARNSEHKQRLYAMIDLARAEVALEVRLANLDANPWLLNLDNGTYDLEADRLQPHHREDFLTKLIPVAYDPEAPAPVWDAFLQRVIPDEKTRYFLQRAVGYMLTGLMTERKMFVFLGGGANGKTTFVETLAELLGPYAATVATSTLLASRQDDAAKNDLYTIQGARFVRAAETGIGRRLQEELIKQVTGGERVKVKRLYYDVIECAPTYKLVLVTNHPPKVRGTDDAIWDRLVRVPFSVRIPEEDRNLRLREQLRAEFPGILRWAIDGCRMWREEGLGRPPEVEEATAAWRKEMDTLGDFLSERCETGDPKMRAPAGALFNDYVNWVERSKEQTTLTLKEFKQALEEKGYRQHDKRTNAGYVWIGIRLRPGAEF